MKKTFLLLIISLFVIPTSAWSKTKVYGRVHVDRVLVKKALTPDEKPFIALKKGIKFKAVGQKGDYVKIIFRHPRKGMLTGWLPRESVKLWKVQSKPKAPSQVIPSIRSVQTSPQPQSTPSWRPSSQTNLRPGSLRARKPTPKPSSKEDFFTIRVGADYHYIEYKVASAGSEALAYKLGGISPRLFVQLLWYQNQSGSFSFGNTLQYQRVFLINDLNLQNSNGDTFSSSQNKQTLDYAEGELFAKIRFGSRSPKAFIIPFAGYQYLSFSAKDSKKANGDPLGLFISSKTMNALGGLKFQFQFQKLSLLLGGGVLVLGSHEEEETLLGSTLIGSGENGSANMGYFGSGNLDFFFKKNNAVGLAYKLLYQTYSFRNSGERTNINLSNTEITNLHHSLGVQYTLTF